MKSIRFFLNGKPANVEGPTSVHDLLGMASLPTDGSHAIIKDGKEYSDPNHPIDIASGDKIEIRPTRPRRPVVHYTVNGEKQTTGVNTLSLEAILRRAGKASAIDVNDIGSYYLAYVSDGRKYEKLDHMITLNEGDEFVAVHKGPTPVA